MANPNPDPWLPDPAPVAWAAPPIQVYKIEEGEDGGSPSYQLLDNVECLLIQQEEGPDPGMAVLRYAFGTGDDEAPQSVEQAMSLSGADGGTLDKFIGDFDRIGVRATRPDGVNVWLFDGIALSTSFVLSGSAEVVTVQCEGVARNAWDSTIRGQYFRSSAAPETVDDVLIGVPPAFNPRGLPNASPSTADAGSGDDAHPTFMDPTVRGTDADGNAYPRPWTLPMAAAYLLYNYNDETYVTNPTRDTLDTLLVSREPNGSAPYDPTDDSTYDAKDIPATDTPFNGKRWHAFLHELIGGLGFGMAFRLSSDDNGNPTTALDLFLKQAVEPKHLYLAPRGSVLNMGVNNLCDGNMGRDLSGVFNQIVVDGAPDQYEVSLVLTPGFPSAPGDASNLAAFNSNDDNFPTAAAHDGYRLWVFAEDGGPYYANSSTARVTGTPTSLDAILGSPDDSTDPPTPAYVARRRPPHGELFKRDASGDRLRYRLAISTNYAGTYPGVWDGTGTWQEVVGGYDLLHDRLGVWVNVKSPNGWDVGSSRNANDPFKSGVVKAVECFAASNSVNKPFFLRLTCVIEADHCLEAVATRQDSSPSARVIERHVDAADRYVVQRRAAHGEFNTGSAEQTNAEDATLRDDTALATAEAIATRSALEGGVTEGEVVIPWLTDFYEIGDRIDTIIGRNIQLQTGSAEGSDPIYPIVVGRRIETSGEGVATVLSLSDAGISRGSRPRNYRAAARAAAVNRYSGVRAYEPGVRAATRPFDPSLS